VLSAIVLVSLLGSSGLKRGLMRFVGSDTAQPRRLTIHAYGVALAVSMVGALVALGGASVWFESLRWVRTPMGATMFLLGTAVWTVFVLQDAVLVGVGRSRTVLVETVAFSVAKIVAVFALVAIGGPTAVVASWVVPGLVAVVVISGGLHRWLPAAGDQRAPSVRHETEGATGAGLTSTRDLLRFAGWDHVATLLSRCASLVLPIIVVARLGASANGHYYVADQIAYGLFLIAANVGDAVVAHGARTDEPLGSVLARAARQIALLLVPGVIGLVVAAPWVMAVFGSGYRAEAVTLVRLLALAAVPSAVTTVAVSACHLRLHMGSAVLLQACIGVGTVAGTLAVAGAHGLAGVGTVVLITHAVAAALAAAILVRMLRTSEAVA
jgi:O-antigen/teichoic acid export membrane protein